MNNTEQEKEILDVKETAEFLRINKATVYKLFKTWETSR